MLLFYLLYNINLKLLSDISILILNKYNERIDFIPFLIKKHVKTLKLTIIKTIKNKKK